MRTLPEGVAATTGGAFDPDAPFTYFIVGEPGNAMRSRCAEVLVAINNLKSQSDRDRLHEMLDNGVKVLLDSGVYTLAMDHVRKHKVSHDTALALPPEEIDGFDRLWDLYADVVQRYSDRVWGIIELDQGTAEHKRRTRQRIESELGIVPMPVYHPLNDGWDYYDELAQGYDRMCFGNIVQAAPPDRLRLAHTAYMRGRDYPYLWTHLLGIGPNPQILGLRSMRGSIDSSTWLAPLRWMDSWRAWAGLRMVANYPPSMWAHSGTSAENYDHAKMERLCGNSARAASMVMREIGFVPPRVG